MDYKIYPIEILDPDSDDGTMPDNVEKLESQVVGHRIVSAGFETVLLPDRWSSIKRKQKAFVITLDNGKTVALQDTSDCCAYTTLDAFLLNVDKVDHVITGVGTTDNFNTWHIYADYGDVLELTVGWSCGNPFYYGYGFNINVVELDEL